MFKALKGGFAFNAIAESMNKLVPRINILMTKIEADNTSVHDLQGETLLLSYYASRDIVSPMKEYGYTMDAKIYVKTLADDRISLMEAYVKTVGTIIQIAGTLGMSDLCESILEKKQVFYDLEKKHPGLKDKRNY